MQHQSLPLVENAMRSEPIAGKVPGADAYYDSANNITVITDAVTVDYRMIRP
jgi:hypothetical protein